MPPLSSASISSISQRVIQCVLGLIPILFVAGLDSPDLLPRLLLFQIATFILAIIWLKSGATVQASPFYLPVLAYIFLMASSALWAITPFRSVHFLAKHITFVCFFFFILNTLKKQHLPDILTITALAGGATSLFGILEYHNMIPQWIPSTGRPSSTFMFRNLAAHYLVTNLPMTGLLFLIARSKKDQWISSICSVLMFVFLLYTRTRGAWVGLFGAVVLNLILWFIFQKQTLYQAIKATFGRQARIFAAISVLFVAILGPLPAGFHEQHTQRFDEKKSDISSAVTSIFAKGGDRGRLKMWHHTLSMIADTPWGVGLGNWEFVYPLYDRGDQISPDTTPTRPHNDLIWITSEIGIPGLLAYLSILLVLLVSVVRTWKMPNASQKHFVVFMCSISVFAMIGDGFFNFPYERIPPSVLFWLSLSFVAICQQESAPSRPINLPIIANSLIPLLLLGTLWITYRNILFDYHYIRAVRATLQSDSNTARNAAKQALAYGPFNHQAFVIYGRELNAEKNYAQAERVLHQALNYHPYFANIYNNIGHVYDDWGQLQKARAAYHKALELMPTHYKAIYNMGIILEKTGHLDSAIVAYHKAIGLSSGFGKAYHNLAKVFNQQGQPDSAKAYYLKALSAVHPTIESYFNLGNLFAEQHQFEQAIKAYEAFIESWTEDPKWLAEAQKGLSEACSGLGVQEEQKGNIDQAFALYQKAISIWPENAMNWYNLGNAQRLKGDAESAIASYQKALSFDPQHSNAYNNLGLTYTERKQFDKAIETFQKSLQIHPDHAIVHLNLANAYLSKGDIYRAISAYEKTLSLWEGDPQTSRQIQDLIKELKASLQQ